MPSTYAHYRFGKDVYRNLPTAIQKEIRPERKLFLIGLHGPDLLFYYKPLSVNKINQIGYHMHERPGIEFFAEAITKIRDADSGIQPAMKAYIYGFLCHFLLDSSCHGYIQKKIESSGITHTEIETEFDRMLMLRDEYSPLTHELTDHIHTGMRQAEIISRYFNGVTPIQIRKALKSMRFYNHLLIAPHLPKRVLILLLLKLTGNYKEMHGLLVNRKPNPDCEDSCRELFLLYKGARKEAVLEIEHYRECICRGNTDLGERYYHTFGAE